MNVSRRGLIFGMLASLALPKSAMADFVEVAPNVFDVGLRNLDPITARQNCEQWCWAASIETIFSTWGYNVPQELLVRSLFGETPDGRLYCRPATNNQMLSAISQTFRDQIGRTFEGNYYVAKDDFRGIDNSSWWQVIITELTNNRPLLAAYRNSYNSGHAVVITHVRVRFNRIGDNDVLGITVRDPWPSSDNRRMLTLNEARNIAFVAAVSVRNV